MDDPNFLFYFYFKNKKYIYGIKNMFHTCILLYKNQLL